jgi:stress-induced morphogen
VGQRIELPKRVKSILTKAYPRPAKVRVRDEDGIIAYVISPLFQGKDDIDRQDMVWNVLDAELETAERREIAIVITVTPEEEAV